MDPKEYKAFEEFIDLLYEFARKTHKYDTTARVYGTDDLLYMTEVHTIRIIGRNPEVTITKIARMTNRTKSAVSQVIDKLVSKNIIIKSQSLRDKRRYNLQLTTKGTIIFDYHENLDQKNYKKILERIDNINLSDIQAGTKVLNQLLKIKSKHINSN